MVLGKGRWKEDRNGKGRRIVLPIFNTLGLGCSKLGEDNAAYCEILIRFESAKRKKKTILLSLILFVYNLMTGCSK